jgi:hypothetical protein
MKITKDINEECICCGKTKKLLYCYTANKDIIQSFLPESLHKQLFDESNSNKDVCKACYSKAWRRSKPLESFKCACCGIRKNNIMMSHPFENNKNNYQLVFPDAPVCDSYRVCGGCKKKEYRKRMKNQNSKSTGTKRKTEKNRDNNTTVKQTIVTFSLSEITYQKEYEYKKIKGIDLMDQLEDEVVQNYGLDARVTNVSHIAHALDLDAEYDFTNGTSLYVSIQLDL